MTNDEGKDKPPVLKLVSDNPSRDTVQARQEAQRKLANLAVTILRNMAGSESAPLIMQSVVDLIDAQKRLYVLTGGWLSSDDEADALSLPQSELNPDASDDRYREWQRSVGMERIVQGALRLAAHQVLGERPHFGGKYSKRLIEDGIAAIERASKRSPLPNASKEKGRSKWADKFADPLRTQTEPDVRRKPWSSRDSRSYRDLKPED
jgi:hypothetical protein